jgi:hypothetical protein
LVAGVKAQASGGVQGVDRPADEGGGSGAAFFVRDNKSVLIPPVKKIDRRHEVLCLRAAAPPTPRADTIGQEN